MWNQSATTIFEVECQVMIRELLWRKSL